MHHNYTLLISLLLIQANYTTAQQPIINIVTPAKAENTVSTAKHFITGTTCNNCTVTVNNTAVKVYKTNVFVYTANLAIGANAYTIQATNGNKSITKLVTYNYQLPKPVKETDSTVIETITIEPNGDVALQPNEYVQIKVKAKPNCTITLNNKYQLTELPKQKGIGGYYQLNYKVKATDSFLVSNFKFALYKNGELKYVKTDKNTYTVFNDDVPTIGATNIVNTPVYSGLGEDRLGGNKIGFLDSGVQVQIIGRINNLLKVKLHNNFSAYIPKELLTIAVSNTPIPKSLTNNIAVYGDSTYDYVSIGLQQKLPYLTTQNGKPNQIILDVFGATNNSNWLTQYPENLQAVEAVNYNQVQDGQFRITIDLKNKQQWGYKLYYQGNNLVLQIRRQKPQLTLANMLIAIDAGHGGSNDGAQGIAGRYEKEFTLLIAKELKALLQAEGATILMTRETEKSYDNQDRLKMLRQKMPDFAISIHLNSAGDPLRVKGASTYYKYGVYKGLSAAIYKRVLETGLNGWGNIGNFNFFLNSPTEFPTALVECLFISNPDDEEKVTDPTFRTNLNQKIVLGIKDWLQQIAEGK